MTPFAVSRDLAGPAALDIAAGLDREIDDHRTRHHARDHVGGQQHRRAAARDQRGADDDVGAAQGLGDQLALAPREILAHLAGIAARGLGGAHRRLIDRDKGRAEALDLLLGGDTDIGGADDRAEPARRRDRLQAGDPGAHHEDPRRLDRAGRGHHHRQGAAERVGGLEHSLVAGEVGLRRQHVHRLRPRDARHQLHRERRDPRRGIGFDVVAAFERREQADQRRASPDRAQLVGGVIRRRAAAAALSERCRHRTGRSA